MTETAITPSETELRADLQGTLPADRFAVVDAWLATQGSPAEVERLLAAAEPPPTALPHLKQARETTDAFTSDGPRGRLTVGEELGAGGMGIVRAAHDRALQRTGALKVLRPRHLHEPLEVFLMREQSLRSRLRRRLWLSVSLRGLCRHGARPGHGLFSRTPD